MTATPPYVPLWVREAGPAVIDAWFDPRAVVAERDRYREALQRILNHGQTHDEPCWALHQGDCAEVMQEIARQTLAMAGSDPS